MFGWKSQTIFQKRRQVLFGLGLSSVYALFAAIAFRGVAVAVLSLNLVLVVYTITRAYLVGRRLVATDLEIEQIVEDPVAPIVLQQIVQPELDKGERLGYEEKQRLEMLMPKPRVVPVEHLPFVPADRQNAKREARRRQRLRAS